MKRFEITQLPPYLILYIKVRMTVLHVCDCYRSGTRCSLINCFFFYHLSLFCSLVSAFYEEHVFCREEPHYRQLPSKVSTYKTTTIVYRKYTKVPCHKKIVRSKPQIHNTTRQMTWLLCNVEVVKVADISNQRGPCLQFVH